MVQFVAGKSVTTSVPLVAVDAGLPIGQHRFQLVVADEAGNVSKPALFVVTINRTGVLVTPLTPIGPVTPVTPIRRPGRNPP